jgi:hypothetical protein
MLTASLVYSGYMFIQFSLALRPVHLAYQPLVLFCRNKSATNNQPVVLFSQYKSTPATSQTNRLLNRNQIWLLFFSYKGLKTAKVLKLYSHR